MRLLALDISSTNVGVAWFEDGEVRAATSYALTGDLQLRLIKAAALMQTLLRMEPDRLAIEAPAFASREHVAIQRATGAMLCQWTKLDVLEIAPTTAKVALTGYGKADKGMMIRAARAVAPGIEHTEHSADAVGIGLAALGKLKYTEAVTPARGEQA